MSWYNALKLQRHMFEHTMYINSNPGMQCGWSELEDRAVVVMVVMACRHNPTMTKSHHGGNMSVMILRGNVSVKHDIMQPLSALW